MVPASTTGVPLSLPQPHNGRPEPIPDPNNNQVRQLLERPEAEEVAAAMCLEFGESPLAPPSPVRPDRERSVSIARGSSDGRPRS